MINIVESAAHIARTVPIGQIRARAHGGQWALREVPGSPGYIGIYATNAEGGSLEPVASTGYTDGSDMRPIYDALLLCAMVNGYDNASNAHGILHARLAAVVKMVEDHRDERDETLARIAHACVDDYDSPVSRAVLAIISDDATARSGDALVTAVRTAANLEEES